MECDIITGSEASQLVGWLFSMWKSSDKRQSHPGTSQTTHISIGFVRKIFEKLFFVHVGRHKHHKPHETHICFEEDFWIQFWPGIHLVCGGPASPWRLCSLVGGKSLDKFGAHRARFVGQFFSSILVTFVFWISIQLVSYMNFWVQAKTVEINFEILHIKTTKNTKTKRTLNQKTTQNTLGHSLQFNPPKKKITTKPSTRPNRGVKRRKPHASLARIADADGRFRWRWPRYLGWITELRSWRLQCFTVANTPRPQRQFGTIEGVSVAGYWWLGGLVGWLGWFAAEISFSSFLTHKLNVCI